MDLGDLHARAWARLIAAADGKADPIVTFGSYGLDGPQMRSVVLRRADAETGTLAFYTDLAAPKIAEIRSDPRAGIHLWDPKQALHIRATGLASAERGPASAWVMMDDAQRRNYGVTPGPGQPIDARDAYTKPSTSAAFGQITLIVNRLDIVHLQEPHARAEYHRATNWQGQWLAP